MSAARLPAASSLAGAAVTVGGMAATYAQAARAYRVLSATGGAAVASVLKAAGSPLADCDYHAAAAPFLPGARPPVPEGGWGRGAAGCPAVRVAFMAALSAEMRRAEAGEPARRFAPALAAARAAFAADSGYAAAMARSANAVASRRHAASLAALLATGVERAAAACAAASRAPDSTARASTGPAGAFTCTVTSACGTGACRFASGVLARLDVAAGPGRVPRPAAHVSRGGFSTAAAAAALSEAVPYVAGAGFAVVAGRPAALAGRCADCAGMKPSRPALRTQVVVSASLPAALTPAQFSSLVAVCVERRLAEMLGPVNCAVTAMSC